MKSKTKWEYYVSSYLGSFVEKEINDLGELGWELVSVTSDENGNAKTYYFKRPLKK